MRKFVGKVVLVVGGGMGMGRAAADMFAAEGATVVISEITRKAGEPAVAAIKAKGGMAYLVHCDITSRGQMKAMVEDAARQAGAIDIVVYSASSSNHGLITEMSDETYDQLVRCNMQSIFWIAKDVAPHLSKAKDKGRLIYISSNSANRGFLPGMIPYAASKAYMNAFARGLALEFGPLNILVNTVEPGMTATERMKSKLPMEVANAIAANYPVPRIGQPDDIANAILFLASAEAAYITGASLLVDGGGSMASTGDMAKNINH